MGSARVGYPMHFADDILKIIKKGERKETNTESGGRRRIFVGVLRSMGSTRVGYLMRFADGTLHQSGLGRL